MKHPIYTVGGGIIGLLSARELARAGRPVVLLDRQAVGKESSWAGGGILSSLYPWRYPAATDRLLRWSQQVFPSLIAALVKATGVDPEWTVSGLLILDANIDEIEANYPEISRFSFERVSATKLAELEPALAIQPESALWRPDVAQVRNPRLITALRQDLEQAGVEFREDVTVTGFSQKQGKLASLYTNQGTFPANQCLVAAGAWTAGLLKKTGLMLPIQPVRGEILLLRARPRLISHILLKDYHYLIPRRDGLILAGSTFEDVGFDKSTTARAKNELLQAAVEMVPALSDCPIEQQWAGLRPGSPDGVPFIGEHPEISGLFVCSGHFRNGIALGPASARLAADLMLGREPLFDMTPYRLARK